MKSKITLVYTIPSHTFQYHILNITGWRATVGERLCSLELERLQHLEESEAQGSGMTMPDLCHDHFSAHDLSSHKEEAEIIYEQYLSEKVRLCAPISSVFLVYTNAVVT